MATAILARSLTSVIASTTGVGGTAVNVDIGFVPQHVRCINVTTNSVDFVWTAGMNSLAAGTTVMGYVASTSGGTTISCATIAAGAGGCSALDGSAGNGIGFIIGTNTTINVAAQAYLCTAWR